VVIATSEEEEGLDQSTKPISARQKNFYIFLHFFSSTQIIDLDLAVCFAPRCFFVWICYTNKQTYDMAKQGRALYILIELVEFEFSLFPPPLGM